MKNNKSQETRKEHKEMLKNLTNEFYTANENCMFQSDVVGALFNRPPHWVHMKCRQGNFIPNIVCANVRYFVKKDVLQWMQENKK